MRRSRFPLLVAAALVAGSCTPTTSPYFPLLPRFRLLDAEVRADGVMLRWSSWISGDDPEGGHHEVEQPAAVRIERSTEGADRGFESVGRHPGGIVEDSMLVTLPRPGQRTWYRAIFLGMLNQPTQVWRSVEVGAPLAAVERAVPLPPASRWSGLDWSPDGTRLLSTRLTAATQSDNAIIQVTDGMTTDLPRPPGGSEALGDCHWSPSGNWITFWSTPTLTSYQSDFRVWVAWANGDSMRTVSETSCWIPAWGATDSSIAFVHGGSIHLANPFRAGSARALPNSDSGSKRDLAVSHSDGRIAYASYARYAAVANIYMLGPAGGDATRLTSGEGTSDVSPAWSPDGKRIAFVSDRAGHQDAWILELATGRLRQVTTGRRFTAEAMAVAWSPDGQELAVLENLGWQEWKVVICRLS